MILRWGLVLTKVSGQISHSSITCASVGQDSLATGPWEEQTLLFLFPQKHQKLTFSSGWYLHQFQTYCWFYYENEVLKTKGISIPPDRRPQTSTALPMWIHTCLSYQVKTAPPSLRLYSHNSSLKVLWISWSDVKVHFLYSSVFSVLINFHVYRFCQLFPPVCPFCHYYFFRTLL